MTCDEVRELLGAYVLGAVDDDERRAIEGHFRTCDRHAELSTLRAVAATLNESVAERTPPPELRQRILRSVSDRQLPRPAQRGGFARFATRFAQRRYALAAVVAALLIGLGAWNVVLQVRLHDSSQAVERFYRGGGGDWIRIQASIGKTPTSLSLGGLRPLPSGQVYALWRTRNGVNEKLATFSVDANDRWSGELQVPLESGDIIMLTIETQAATPTPAPNPLMKILI